uniref:Gag-Pol polyprotein n=1 Tax=Tanacetum cinerariifolium TaxID=118510 RepID=A0A699H2Y6_TANCI|nr:hypothetical protein [Tanacetum cinerariifolium]
MHNNIMAAGSRDHPRMLAPRRYAQWQSHFLRYVDTKPKGEALRKCILQGRYNKEHYQFEKEAIHLLLTGIGHEIYSTVDACKTAHDMWIAIERLQQEWSRFVTIVKQTQDLDTVSYHKLFDILKQYQKEVNEIRAERNSKNATPLALVFAAQLIKDYNYHKEKMLLYKQAKKGVPLQAEQADWIDDTNEEVDEQELEVQHDDNYNVFANDRQHYEQPESINDTYMEEKVDSNVIPDSPDKCDNVNHVD